MEGHTNLGNSNDVAPSSLEDLSHDNQGPSTDSDLTINHRTTVPRYKSDLEPHVSRGDEKEYKLDELASPGPTGIGDSTEGRSSHPFFVFWRRWRRNFTHAFIWLLLTA